MAASSIGSCRDIGDYLINKDDTKCLGRTQKVYVYPGIHKESGTRVAGKMFLWDKCYSTEHVDAEIALMNSIPAHENVLKLLHHDSIDVGKYNEMYLILEHCPHGHLGQFATSRPLSLPQKIDLMCQAARGVQHLHHMDPPLIHRDIKPPNILIAGEAGQPVVKIADFGESRYFEGSHAHSLKNITLTGTPNYLAPELYNDKQTYRPKQNLAVDIFALGLSFQYLLDAEMDVNTAQKNVDTTQKNVDTTPMKVGGQGLGEYLHENPDDDVFKRLIKLGDRADVRAVKRLISKMLARTIRDRLTIDQVVMGLEALRRRLGTQLLLAVDTVWTPVFYLNKDLMETVEGAIESRLSSAPVAGPQQNMATRRPTGRDARRKDREKCTLAGVMGVLSQLRRLLVDGGHLLTVVNEYFMKRVQSARTQAPKSQGTAQSTGPQKSPSTTSRPGSITSQSPSLQESLGTTLSPGSRTPERDARPRNICSGTVMREASDIAATRNPRNVPGRLLTVVDDLSTSSAQQNPSRRCGQLLAVGMCNGDRGVYVHGGSEWRGESDVPSDCIKELVCLCRVADGIVACGGLRHSRVSSRCHHFSRLTGKWCELASMVTPRCGASAVEYRVKEILVAGGRINNDENSESDVCEVLDCAKNRWFPAANLTQALVKPLMAAEAGQVYVLEQSGDIQDRRLFVYEPSSEESDFSSELPEWVKTTMGSSLAAAASKLYLLGGEAQLALEYDVDTDQWYFLTPPTLLYDWKRGCCAVSTPGSITVYGGYGKREYDEEYGLAEKYDIGKDKWETLALRLPRCFDQHTSLVAQFDSAT